MTIPQRTIEHARKESDLLALAGLAGTRKAAGTNGGEWKGPCPFCGGTDRFCVWPEHPDGYGRWWCRQCERGGDAIDFVREKFNLDFEEAISQLLGGDVPTVKQTTPDNSQSAQRRTTPTTSAGPPPAEWQETVWPLVERFEEALWSEAGERARQWLRDRYGLRDETIRAWRLGYCPRGREYAGVYVHRGITIPWWCSDDLWAVKIRLPVAGNADNKYRRIACDGWNGVKEALYGVQHWDRSLTDCYTTEGEFDAIYLWQAADGRANVLTAGNDGGTLADRWVPLLLDMEHVWIATDADYDRRAARYWFDVVGRRGRRAAPPGAHKDITDAWRAGEDIKSWVAGRLGGDEAEQTEQHDVDDDDMEALFLSTCALLDRMEANSQRRTLYDQAETAYCDGDYDAMVIAHTTALAALYMEEGDLYEERMRIM